MRSPLDVLHGPLLALSNFAIRLALFLLLLVAPSILRAQTISGVVQDPSGAVVAGARIEIIGGDLTQPIILTSDGQGKFTSPELKPESYSVRVVREGFDPLVKTVDLSAGVQLQLTLAIARQQENISVTGKSLAFANSDQLYKQLRGVGPGPAYRFDNFTLTWDAGTFHFEKGTLTVLAPINGILSGAIFIGEGHFNLKPVLPPDAHELNRRTGADEFNEDFNEVVFRFTRAAWPKLAVGAGDGVPNSPEAAAAFNRWKERMRQRREVPVGFTQFVLQGETMDNVDADILAASYNPTHPEFFNAYIHGKKRRDLRFLVRDRVGAIPQLDSPEEVGLINYDPEGMDDGVWYLSHLKSEFENHIANSRQDRRLFATHGYKIETVIAKNAHLFSTATITFESLVAGERVLKFGLLPNLRVTRVSGDQGQDLYFIQESRKEDGSFYAILPQAPPLGKEQSITVEYSGDKVLEQAGEGSYYVAARTSWYPNLNGFGGARALRPDVQGSQAIQGHQRGRAKIRISRGR